MNSLLGATPSANTQPGISPQVLSQFQQFKNSFRGNPKQAVMQMLQNGQITNPQLQQAMQMAKQLQGILK